MENSTYTAEFDLADLPIVAAEVASRLTQKVVLLQGNMGAGKTTFIKALCKVLGVLDEVSSPTFSLVNEYLCADGQTIYHFDLYRIESEKEAIESGIDEFLHSGMLCLIEWPDKIPNLLPENLAVISLKISGNKRLIDFRPQVHNS